MKPIDCPAVQPVLDRLQGRPLYLHLETTSGAYAKKAVTTFLRNGQIQFERAKITGEGPYRVGLQLAQGWVYADGLTHWLFDEQGRLLLAGHDAEGRLAVALQLSPEPFA